MTALRAAAEALASALDDFAERRLSAPDKLESLNQIESLNQALAGGLPALFDQLRQTAVSVTLDDLPDDIRRDWIAPDGTVRVQAIPTAAAADGDELEAFAARMQAVSAAATGVPADHHCRSREGRAPVVCAGRPNDGRRHHRDHRPGTTQSGGCGSDPDPTGAGEPLDHRRGGSFSASLSILPT